MTQCAVSDAKCECDEGKTVYYAKNYLGNPDWEYGWAQEVMDDDKGIDCKSKHFKDLTKDMAYSSGGYCYCGSIDNVY